MQAAAHKGFRQLQPDKACADNNNVLNAAFGNFLIYRFNIPREPEAVNTCGISIRQGKLHRRTAGCQHQHVIRQLFQLSIFHIMHAFLHSVYFLHITAAAGVNALHSRKIITVAQGSLRCMVKAVHALDLTADKIRKAAGTVAQLRSAFQHNNLCFCIKSAQARCCFHAGCYAADDYYTFTHNVTSIDNSTLSYYFENLTVKTISVNKILLYYHYNKTVPESKAAETANFSYAILLHKRSALPTPRHNRQSQGRKSGLCSLPPLQNDGGTPHADGCC